MAKAIAWAILILLASGTVLYVAYIAGSVGMSRKIRKMNMAGVTGARHLDAAAKIFRDLGSVSNPDEFEVISDKHRQDIDQWLVTYDKERNRK